MAGFFEFGDFRFDPEKRILWRGGELVALPPKAGEVLSLLIENRGDLVERSEILEKVWSETFVEEANVNYVISLLRKTLGGNGIIQTIPRRGYRFSAELKVSGGNSIPGLVIERRTISETHFEESEYVDRKGAFKPGAKHRMYIVVGALFGCAVLIAAVWMIRPGGLKETSAIPKVFAVIPFNLLNEGVDDKILATGLSESIVQRLSNINDLTIRPPFSVNAVSGLVDDPVEIGRRLNADSIMTGSLQRSGDRIRLNVWVINVSDGSQIWTGSFDEEEKDILRLQDALAAQAANHLIRQYSLKAQEIAKRTTDDPEAYRLYIRGRYAWNKRTRESLIESEKFFKDAIDRDPTFALAYAGLAEAYAIFGDYAVATVDEAGSMAKAAAIKALEIEPSLLEPRLTLAYTLAVNDWNFTGAEREYKSLIAAGPNIATAHQWYGEMLYTLKRFSESETELQRAATLDPLAPIIRSEIAVLYYYSRRFDESLAVHKKLQAEDPEFRTPYLFSAWNFDQKGMFDDAFREEMEFERLQGTDQKTLDYLTRSYEHGGRSQFLSAIADKLEHDAGATSYRLVHAYARLRDKEKTLFWLEKGVEERTENIVKAGLDPNFDFLRGDPRYESCLSRMNLR